MNETLANKIKNAIMIIVHGGNYVHFDEFTACAIARAVGCTAPILRGNPTPGELDDEYKLIMDVGFQLNPDKLNFDHHQLSRENTDSAYMLLAKALEIDNTLSEVYEWFDLWSKVDCHGPFDVAKELGYDKYIFRKINNVVSGDALDLWGENPNSEWSQALLDKHSKRIKYAVYHWDEFMSKTKLMRDYGINVGDLRGLDEYHPLHSAFIRNEEVNVTVYDDDRKCITVNGVILTEEVDDFYHLVNPDDLEDDETLLDNIDGCISSEGIEGLPLDQDRLVGKVYELTGKTVEATDANGTRVSFRVARVLLDEGEYTFPDN